MVASIFGWPQPGYPRSRYQLPGHIALRSTLSWRKSKKTWSLTNQPWALSVVELGDLSRRQCSHLQPGFAFRPVTAAVGGVQLLHSFQAAMHLHTGSRAHGSCVQQSQQATDLFGMIFMDEERPLFFQSGQKLHAAWSTGEDC